MCDTVFGDFEKLENYKIVAYNDSSFGNLADGRSQGGFVIYLVNECGQASPIMWQSRKLQRIVKSAMAAETLIQMDCAEACYWIGSLMNEIIHADHTKQAIPVIQCNTDSHHLYDAVHSIRAIQDKRLRVDMAILREMLEKQELKIG